MTERECSACGMTIEEDEEFFTQEDGTILCKDCYTDAYPECDGCGERVPVDELMHWGDLKICPDCMEYHCPSFDEAENEAETEEAYMDMRARYLGKKVSNLEPGEHDLSCEQFNGEEAPRYDITVTIGEDGTITDISRLTAQLLLCEDVKSSDWLPYPIDSVDYEDVVEELFDDYIEFEDEEDESDH